MKKQIPEIIYGLLVFLFVYAACSKLFDYAQFRIELSRAPMIAPFGGVIFWLVPATELTTVSLLTVKATRIWGLYASFILLLIFTLYIAAMLLSGENLPCSCGGVINTLSWKQHLIFNIFFMALSIVGIVLWWKQKNMEGISKSENKTF